jgi:hypothetical protein
MQLKIVSKGHGKIGNLIHLSQSLSINSEIYLIKEDKDILLGVVSHSLLILFVTEFAEWALQNYSNQNYTKSRTHEAELCISLIKKWIEDNSSVSRKEFTAAANAVYYTANSPYNAVYYAAKATDYSIAGEYSSYAAYAAAGVSGVNKNQELERQGKFILDYFHSNAWLFNL